MSAISGRAPYNPIISLDFEICIALIMNCQNIQKELSVAFSAPENKFLYFRTLNSLSFCFFDNLMLFRLSFSE